MKNIKKKDTKEQYDRIVEIVKKAERAADKFVRQNKQIDPQLRVRFS